MDRSPLVLAALASAAVPGLDPVTVESVPSRPGDRFDSAIVRDTEHRHWVVRAPRSETAAAALDGVVALLALLTRRLSVAVPAPKGFIALKAGGRASVHPLLPGHPLDFAALPPGPGLASELGRAIAAVHNLDPALYDEAGIPAYDAESYRARRLADLDRAAATGRVPIGLLTRWEHALEDVGLWRFATTPTHGALSGDHVLAVFDGDDASTGRVRGLLAWEDAEVGDPGADFARLVHEATPEAVDAVYEGYAHSRVERPDPNLLVRARLHGELSLLRELMDALARRDEAGVEELTGRLRRLDDQVHSLEESSDDYRRMSLDPTRPRASTVTRGRDAQVGAMPEAGPVADADADDHDGRGTDGDTVDDDLDTVGAETRATFPSSAPSLPTPAAQEKDSRSDETMPLPVSTDPGEPASEVVPLRRRDLKGPARRG